MADFVYNIGLGRVVELYNRVDANDPANAVLTITVINTTALDSTLKRLDTISEVLADVNTAEVTNTGYARKELTDADIVAFAPDDVNDWVELDIPDQTWTAVIAGDSWTDFQICYDPDSTSGTDSDIVPLTQHDLNVTPDGSDITVQINNFYKAS